MLVSLFRRRHRRSQDASSDLLGEIENRLCETLERLGDSNDLGPFIDRGTLSNFRSAVTLLHRSKDRSSLDASELRLAIDDLNQVWALLEMSRTPPNVRVLETRIQRATATLNSLAKSVETAYAQSLPTLHTVSDPILTKVAEAYGQDATRERRSSQRALILAILFIGATAAAAFWVVRIGSTIPEHNVWPSVLGPGLLCLTTSIGATVCFRQAASHLKNSREYIRLERGLVAIPHYLSSLPPEAQHLIRATMTQSLFPRLIEDDDPARQIIFPKAETMLVAINPDTFAEVDEAD